MTRRLLAVGRLGRWTLVQEGERPLPPEARRKLEALWPPLEGPEYTPEQCEAWLNEHFADKERVTK